MASYQSFITHISHGEIISAYTGLLTDINYCLNLLDDIETGRTYTETFIDAWQGDRNKISGDLNTDLKELKGEIEAGIGVYTNLIFKLSSLKVLKNIYEPRLEALSYSPDGKSSRFGFIDILKSQFDDFRNEIDLLKSPESIPQEATTNTWGSWAYGYVNSCAKYVANKYDPSTYEDRSLKYKKVKALHDALNQTEILKIFRENHLIVKEMIEEIENAAVNLNSQPSENANIQPNT